jgi:hypothetical protein
MAVSSGPGLLGTFQPFHLGMETGPISGMCSFLGAGWWTAEKGWSCLGIGQGANNSPYKTILLRKVTEGPGSEPWGSVEGGEFLD